MKLIDSLVNTSQRPLSKKNKFLAKVLPVFVFLFLFVPLLFILPVSVFDNWLNLPTLARFPFRFIPGGILTGLGLFFIRAATKAQREIGKGTPMPLKATNTLVIEKPYSYCRNPLYFGLINFFLGISLMLGSISSIGMVALFSFIILAYIKFIEEKELEKRYGDHYLEYKKETPLLIPKISDLWRIKK